MKGTQARSRRVCRSAFSFSFFLFLLLLAPGTNVRQSVVP